MSQRRLTVRSTVTALVAAGVVGGAVATASPAAAEPGRGDLTCAQPFDRAGTWPGTITVDGQEHRLYSDAYELYLSRQEPCSGSQA